MADVEMKQSLDELLKNDKKNKKPSGGQPRRGGALPGKGRGGSNQNNSNKQNLQYVPRQTAQNQINKNQQRKQTEQRQQQRHMRRGGPVHTQSNEQRQTNNNNQQQKQRQNNANSNDNQPNRRQQIQQLKQRSRGTIQNPRQRIARQTNNNQPAGQYQQKQNHQQNKQMQQRNLPKSPVMANQSPNSGRNPKTLTVVKGQLAQRKIKVRNIDPRAVSTQDLYKLFAKSGQLISATFDTNEFGQYIGTATIIYTNANGAARAIKDYHLAQIDKRTMRVDYAMQPAGSGTAQSGSPIQVKAPPIQQVATGKGGRGGVAQSNQNQRGSSIRRTDARIQKTGRGRTLNVSGSDRKNYRRGSRQ